MGKRIVLYRRRIDATLAENSADTDWQALLEEHLVQIGFFQHERLVHLLVTLMFGFFSLVAFLMTLRTLSYGAAAIMLVLFIVTIAYVLHYFTLENETQKMYFQYDEILKHLHDRTV
ncbi:MAG: hypothetical protein LUI02_00300 [Clostridiales bacterium]|nr:hypothetical protein [Clostridiales bacterium]